MKKILYSKDQIFLIERLKQARLDADLTQTEVAKKLKVTQAYVSKIESGQVRLDIFQLKTFANLYKKDVDAFIWKDKKERERYRKHQWSYCSSVKFVPITTPKG